MSEADISSYVSERSSPHSKQSEGGDELPSRRSQKGPVTAISGDFIKKEGQSSGEFHLHSIDKLRSMVKRWTSNKWITQVMGLVILFDAYCNCTDIDARAQGPDVRPPEFFQVGGAVCLVLYTVESCLVLFGQGWIVLTDRVFLIDLCVIVCGYVEMILDGLSDQSISASFGILRLLRLARVMRLLRLLRKSRALRELQKLVIMMSTCMKALIWSFIFCFVIMTIWAMLMVEMVYPLIQELHRENPNIFGDCEQCLWATSSVMEANLLLFKTVIAGDSWGTIAVPVIEHHPATAIIFVGSLLTLVFGVLNLIVAVVVDTFADARDRDILNLAEEMEQDMEADKRFLERIFNRIDVDKSGQLSLAQLVDGARKDAEFQSRLRVMDIDEMDLAQLFDMIDTDGSGFIESNEFIRPLSRWVHDSKTAPRFIKYNLMRTMQQQEEIQEHQTELKRSIETNFTALSERMDLIKSPNSSPYLLKTEDKTVSFKESCIDRASTEPMETVISMKREEGLVQPHPSKKVTTLVQKMQDSEANLKDAMERLEELVLHATESALRESTDMIGQILLEKLKESNLRQELDFVLPAVTSKLVTSPAPDPPTARENLATAIVGRPPEVNSSMNSMNNENGIRSS